MINIFSFGLKLLLFLIIGLVVNFLRSNEEALNSKLKYLLNCVNDLLVIIIICLLISYESTITFISNSINHLTVNSLLNFIFILSISSLIYYSFVIISKVFYRKNILISRKSQCINEIVRILSSILIEIFILFLMVNLNSWIRSNFPEANIHQILFFLMIPGIEAIDRNLIFESFVILIINIVLVTFANFIFVLIFYSTNIIDKANLKELSSILFKLVLISIFVINNFLDISGYFVSLLSKSDFIKNHYVNPDDVILEFPNRKRNLIFIYLESMESSFSLKKEGGLLNVNLVPNLSNLSKTNINFSDNAYFGGFKQLDGTGWTIASLFATSSGLPFLIPIDGNSYKSESFFPGVVTIGDILSKQGYTQLFMIGSNAKFGGRDLFYNQHGNFKIFDYNHAIDSNKVNPEDYVWWGYEDSDLYKFAKEELLVLSQSSNPFNFTILTVDTHATGGWLSKECKTEYEIQLMNVIKCSDYMVADFISWIQQQEFYENTTIIISGDHLYMGVLDSFDTMEYNDRNILSVFINSPIKPIMEKNRNYSALDMFPSALASLGVRIEGDQLGLGVNLFGNKKTLLEKYSIETVNEEFNKYSQFYFDTFFK